MSFKLRDNYKNFSIKYEILISRVLPYMILRPNHKEEILRLLLFFFFFPKYQQIRKHHSSGQWIERKYHSQERIWKYLHSIFTGNHMCSLELFRVSTPEVSIVRKTLWWETFKSKSSACLWVCMEPRIALEYCRENGQLFDSFHLFVFSLFGW